MITQENVQGAPDLVVEVLSQATRARDPKAKFQVYAQLGVRYYWVVDPEAERVQAFALACGRYAEVAALRGNDRLRCPLFPDVSTTVGDILVP